jgi:hypothetical protein
VNERRIYRDSLRQAMQSMGGMQQLAARLDVNVELVDRWIAGLGKPPLHVFLEILDAIAEGPWRNHPGSADATAPAHLEFDDSTLNPP